MNLLNISGWLNIYNIYDTRIKLHGYSLHHDGPRYGQHYITSNNSGDVDDLVSFIHYCNCIIEFTMQYYCLRKDEWIRIFRALSSHHSQHLKHLNVSCNEILITSTKVSPRCNALAAVYSTGTVVLNELMMQRLKSLDLSNVTFDMMKRAKTARHLFVCASDVSRWLRETKTLHTLKLQKCSFLCKGTFNEIMANGIAKNQSLKYLTICVEIIDYNNSNVFHNSIIRNPSIKQVDGVNSYFLRDSLDHDMIRVQRNIMRDQRIGIILLLIATEWLPPEMMEKVVNHIDIPVKYIGKWQPKN